MLGFSLIGLCGTAALAQTLHQEKVLILSLTFERNILRADRADIIYGTPPNAVRGTLLFRLATDGIEGAGATYADFQEADPRMADDRGHLDNVSFRVILPYTRANALYVFDNSTRLLSLNLSENFAAFCSAKNNICDFDCLHDADCPRMPPARAGRNTTTTATTAASPGGPAASNLLLILALLALALLWIGYGKFRERRILEDVGKRRSR